MSEIFIIGIDTGGTFTDCVGLLNGQIYTYKCLSTPDNPSQAVLQGIQKLSKQAQPTALVHGTTVATNALLERKGGKIALVTTAGFRDLIDIGRQNRPSLYDLRIPKPSTLVPISRRFEIAERVNADGEVLIPLDQQQLRALKPGDVEAIAICFLFSFLYPQHEKEVAKCLREQGYEVSASHEILPEYREYERFSTTIANAYLQPVMKSYMLQLEEKLMGLPCRIIQSNGGSLSIQATREHPVTAILSGPAAGVVGALEIAKNSGIEKIISFDMGGTSTDVALCNGKLSLTAETILAGIPLKTPMIDIHTVGAGGGSIAWLDAGGALRVGPDSAGANPGPICYGQQQKNITVTDANLFLGRLLPHWFLGGHMELDTQPLQNAFEHLGQMMGCSPESAALGVIQVVNTNMERALRVVSVDKGHDPCSFVLVCFGGAGGLHACALATHLNIDTILIPPHAGVLSAIGMLYTDTVRDYSWTVLHEIELSDHAALAERYQFLIRQAIDDFQMEPINSADLIFEKQVDLRYRGQSFELNLPLEENTQVQFHELHQRRYGYHRLNHSIELVTIRLRAIAPSPPLKLSMGLVQSEVPLEDACLHRQPVFFEAGYLNTPFYHREKLQTHHQIPGPAVILEDVSTILIPPGFLASLDKHKNLILRFLNA